MRRYTVCIESYYSNNSDRKEYDNYYILANNWNEAMEYAKKCINNWNKQGNGVLYHIFNLYPHN